MKISIFIMSLFCIINNATQSPDLFQISESVHTFSTSADTRDVDSLQELLHDNFRAIVNQAFGTKEVQFMDKAMYLDLLEKEVIGGDQRFVTILSMDVEERNAVVKAKLVGKDLSFITFIQLIKDIDGKWRIMSDMPLIVKAP